MESFKLRAWTKADIPALAKYLNNKKIWDNCRDALPYPYTEKDAEQFISFVEGQSEQNNYCIEINHEAAGNISFFRGTDVDHANVYENNPASMKVLEKAGFHKCGIFRKACFKNGQFVDCHCYELVNLKKIN